MLFLGATPDLSIQEDLSIGCDVESCIENDLKLEYKVVSDLIKAAIKLCEQEQDFVTRTMLTSQLEDTEQNKSIHLLLRKTIRLD